MLLSTSVLCLVANLKLRKRGYVLQINTGAPGQRAQRRTVHFTTWCWNLETSVEADS